MDIQTSIVRGIEKKYRSGSARPFSNHGTIKVNIAMYQDIGIDQQVPAEFVDADSFIRDLPLGYDALLSERGSSFQLGQRPASCFCQRTVCQSTEKILIFG